MYPFFHSVTPAVRSHLDAQVAFFNDMSKSMTRSFQNLCELNIQLGQTLLEEGNIAAHKMLTTESATDAISATTSRAQPAADKLRAYQQHVSRIVADAQIDLAQVTGQHAEVTSRTARTLADEVAKVASDEVEKSNIQQQEIMKGARDPFQQKGASHRNGSAEAHGNMQSAGNGVDATGKRDGASVQAGEQALHQQPGNKGSAKPG